MRARTSLRPFAKAPRAIRSRTGNRRAERKKERRKQDGRNSRKGETRKETHVAIIREEKTGISNRQPSRVEKQNREEMRNENIT
jgi:hypothetical protein